MTTENELINKTYYRSILDETKQGHSVKILGEMYMEKMQTPEPDLSTIRFAQGEVYFLNNDYEAAIFKWQHPMDTEFIPWAKKNIADAHLEMELLDEAKKFYKQVDTSSLTLKSEVLLQLFSLYTKQNHQEEAVRTIREAVRLNPDYSGVTEIAQLYFEDIRDFEYAIELAINEALRTETTYWVEVLSGYIEKGLTVDYKPMYFNDLLVMLRQMDESRFESFLSTLWHSYRDSNRYLELIVMANNLLISDEALISYEWEKLPELHKRGYFDLISGRYFTEEISEIIKGLFANWLQVSTETNALLPSTAILAWNEMFPEALEVDLVNKAELLFGNSQVDEEAEEYGLDLFESIKVWAGREGLFDELSDATGPMLDGYNIKSLDPVKIRDVIKFSIEFLLEQKVKLENNIQQDIDASGRLLTSLHDTNSQIGERESETTTTITTSFLGIKNSLTKELKQELPKLLNNCASLINEQSNFATLDADLNEEMNKQVATYMNKYVNNHLDQTIQTWVADCKGEFEENQMVIDELSANLNQQLLSDEIILQGDFKVLDDWRRDLERMARSLLRVEKVNFLMRNTPSQLLFKGAGKLVGSISKNKDMLHNKYKNYIENTDFTSLVEDIISPFNQQLELFAESIEWDVERFFTGVLEVLNHETEKAQLEINSHKDSLNKMQEHPEIYQNPLTLFELRLRQFELMNTIDE